MLSNGELLARGKKLLEESATSPVKLIESAAYNVLAHRLNLKSVLLGSGGFVVPAYYQEFNPTLVAYAMAVESDRRDGQDQAKRFWDRMAIYARNRGEELQQFTSQLREFPALMLSVSTDQIGSTAAYLGVEKQVLLDALVAVPYWKASEMLEFRSATNPEHDIVSWIMRDQNLSFDLALQHHYLHEAHHSAIDAFAVANGWMPSNFLTEGWCEFASASFEIHKAHAEELLSEFRSVKNISWQSIREKLLDGTHMMRFSDYTLGWAVIHHLAVVFAGSREPEYGAMKLLFALKDHAVQCNLLATFDAVFDNDNLRNQFDDLIKAKLKPLIQPL